MPLKNNLKIKKDKKNKWSNRLIEGDSLKVMGLLKSKLYGLRGGFKMIYIDPSYGPKFNKIYSNYYFNQNNYLPINIDTVNFLSKELLSKKVNIAQPDYLKSEKRYYSYLFKMLSLSKDLLRDDGNLFIQSPKKTLGNFLSILSTIFHNNLISIIPFNKRGLIIENNPLVDDCDFLIWFCKNKKKIKHNTIAIKNKEHNNSLYILANLKDEKNIYGYRYNLRFVDFYSPLGDKIYWSISEKDMLYLFKKDRLVLYKNSVYCKVYYSDLNFEFLNDLWSDTADPRNKNYPVQTCEDVVKRCIIMGSNPGDLVLDPTCGSGTTPAVASKTGRRWIACDISPEAISSTKKRLLSDQKNCKVKYNNKEACYSDKVLEKVVKKLVYGENFIIIDNYANYIKHPFIVRRINHK